MSRSTGKRKRVPAALHTEITEYAYLMRSLRTQHALDLSTHLSQVPSSSQSSPDEESESSLLDSEPDSEDLEAPKRTPSMSKLGENGEEAHTVRSTEPEQEEQADHDGPGSPNSPHSSQETETDRLRRRKKKMPRKRTRDLWTRWPLLAGDVYPSEFGLEDEVQSIASGILRQRRHQPFSSEHDTDQGSELGSDEDSDGLDELDDVSTRAYAASTAHHLRSLLSACAATVPCVEPSLRCRLAPLDWMGVLRAAAAGGLVSPEVLERVGSRLTALYGSKSQAVPEQSSQSNTPEFLQRLVHSTSAVRAARERLKSLYEERIEQGDGDFFSFVEPPRKPKKRKKPRNKIKNEEVVPENEADGPAADEEKPDSHSEDGPDERIVDITDGKET